ncbi:hypothetical protein BDK51DRAFT_46209 [Blyttiomyces helicus]|uniref:Uncharacterized protein n=1 Tax=Blyttiomyces helicus TaxID=388810 RepID=A0A4P9VZX2_9FUNG|nr:hypothetical protein BDK51DRAFT_46209 [Blyttiomyces helicus]|eukprot:RKO84585.1 hypothetical protein BDK51DRAFT_46209 [Blyttiomyces helicus]
MFKDGIAVISYNRFPPHNPVIYTLKQHKTLGLRTSIPQFKPIQSTQEGGHAPGKVFKKDANADLLQHGASASESGQELEVAGVDESGEEPAVVADRDDFVAVTEPEGLKVARMGRDGIDNRLVNIPEAIQAEKAQLAVSTTEEADETCSGQAVNAANIDVAQRGVALERSEKEGGDDAFGPEKGIGEVDAAKGWAERIKLVDEFECDEMRKLDGVKHFIPAMCGGAINTEGDEGWARFSQDRKEVEDGVTVRLVAEGMDFQPRKRREFRAKGEEQGKVGQRRALPPGPRRTQAAKRQPLKLAAAGHAHALSKGANRRRFPPAADEGRPEHVQRARLPRSERERLEQDEAQELERMRDQRSSEHRVAALMSAPALPASCTASGASEVSVLAAGGSLPCAGPTAARGRATFGLVLREGRGLFISVTGR